MKSIKRSDLQAAIAWYVQKGSQLFENIII